MRILIVEDEMRLAETLRQLLEDQRYQVDTVYDGADGVDYGLAGQYDLIILDVMLPKMDGFQVAQRLRAAHVSTPILMLTARDDVSDKISGLDCGADDYMTKPFDTGELMARVRALTRRQGEVLSDVLTVNDLSLDCTSRLHSRALRVRLGFKEFGGTPPAHGEQRERGHQGDPDLQDLGAGLRGGGQQCGGLHLLPAEEAGLSQQPGVHLHRAEGGVLPGHASEVIVPTKKGESGMLRRLRLKFILTNMLLVTVVLLAVFGALMISTAQQLERESAAAMKLALRQDGIPPQLELHLPDQGGGAGVALGHPCILYHHSERRNHHPGGGQPGQGHRGDPGPGGPGGPGRPDPPPAPCRILVCGSSRSSSPTAGCASLSPTSAGSGPLWDG